MMEKLYKDKRNTITHNDFNRTHIKTDGNIRRILSEAVDILIDLSKSISFEYDLPDNRGAKKYLQTCFVNTQVIKLLDVKGDNKYFDIEKDLSKIGNKFPVYLKMINDFNGIKPNKAVDINTFFNQYYEIYGQGEIAIALFFLLLRRYFGDSLRFKKDEQSLTDLKFENIDNVIDLITGKIPSACAILEPIDEQHKLFFKEICSTFSKENIQAGKNFTIFDAYKSIEEWWNNLTPISHSEDFYMKENKNIISLFNKIKTSDPYYFIKVELLEQIGLNKDEILSKDKISNIKQTLTKIKENCESVLTVKENQVIKIFSEIFGIQSTLDIDIQDGLKNWYNNKLDSLQKDPLSIFHNNDSKPIINNINDLSDIRKLICYTLPNSYSLDPIKNWTTDKTDIFINKIKSGKKHIEDNASKVGKINFKFSDHIRESDKTVYYKGQFAIIIKKEKNNESIYFTDNGDDPSNENSSRKIISDDKIIIEGGTKDLKFVSSDNNGHFGIIYIIKAIDESSKHQVSKQSKNLFGEQSASFIFPQNEDDIKITFTSLIKLINESKIITLDKLEKIFKEIIEKFK